MAFGLGLSAIHFIFYLNILFYGLNVEGINFFFLWFMEQVLQIIVNCQHQLSYVAIDPSECLVKAVLEHGSKSCLLIAWFRIQIFN